MDIMAEVAILFGICLVSQGISALLPFAFPASVISMLLLLALLASGVVKERYVQRICGFFLVNMTFFFIAPCVTVMEYASTLLSCLIPFLLISLLTTPIVYGVTAWVIQGIMALRRRKEGRP